MGSLASISVNNSRTDEVCVSPMGVCTIILTDLQKQSLRAYGWSNKPPPLARKMPSQLFKYRWASLASKEGAFTKKTVFTICENNQIKHKLFWQTHFQNNGEVSWRQKTYSTLQFAGERFLNSQLSLNFTYFKSFVLSLYLASSSSGCYLYFVTC